MGRTRTHLSYRLVHVSLVERDRYLKRAREALSSSCLANSFGPEAGRSLRTASGAGLRAREEIEAKFLWTNFRNKRCPMRGLMDACA
jgi:hypothetical protein